jgi:hypothetical protein
METKFLNSKDYTAILSDILKENDYPEQLLNTLFEKHKANNPNFLEALQKATNVYLSEILEIDLTLPFKRQNGIKYNNAYEEDLDRDINKLFLIGHWIDQLETEPKTTEIFTISQKLIILHLTESFKNLNFSGKHERQFLGQLLNENPESIKKPATDFIKMIKGETTPKQAESYKKTLEPILKHFEKIGYRAGAQKIKSRIFELESYF